MKNIADTPLAQRLSELVAASGESARKLSLRLFGNPDAIRKIIAGHKPDPQRVAICARAFGVSVDYLLGTTDDPHGAMTLPATAPYPTASEVRAPAAGDPALSWSPRGSGRDVPVVGTAAGSFFVPEGSAQPVELSTIHSGETIDFVLRPPKLAGRMDVYALYVVSDSQLPRYRPGELIYVDARRPAVIGDDVVVQLCIEDEDGADGKRVVGGLVKELVKRTATHIVLRQFNPPLDFRVAVEQVKSVHRVIPLAELVGV